MKININSYLNISNVYTCNLTYCQKKLLSFSIMNCFAIVTSLIYNTAQIDQQSNIDDYKLLFFGETEEREIGDHGGCAF